MILFFFFSSRRRHTRSLCDWSSDVCSSDLPSFVRDIFAGEGGAALTEKTAYSGSGLSRTGWHDDALLALPTDLGTYAQPGWDRSEERRVGKECSSRW